MTALAPRPDYTGMWLRAVFASELGHWDVSDACAVLPEAWELVERGHVTADDFKAFIHDSALALGRRDVHRHRHSSPMTARWQTGTVA